MEVALASEFRYCDPIVDEHTLVIVISQSGETADTLAALRQAKELGARTLGVVNVVGSSIAKECDDVLYTWAGPEIAVATTKAYSTQLGVLYLLGLHFADVLGRLSSERYDNAGAPAAAAAQLPGAGAGAEGKYPVSGLSRTSTMSPSSSSAATSTTPWAWRVR